MLRLCKRLNIAEIVLISVKRVCLVETVEHIIAYKYGIPNDIADDNVPMVRRKYPAIQDVLAERKGRC